MARKTTNVKASELNYDHYPGSKYDSDVTRNCPFYEEMHKRIREYLEDSFNPNKRFRVLDVGVGTGITSGIARQVLPKAEFKVIDFSRQMLRGAKKRLGTKGVKYIFGDYSKVRLGNGFNIAICVLGLHHQTEKGKKLMFKKIFSSLNNGGAFIYGDLVTYKNKKQAALNSAKHYHNMVNKSTNDKNLAEWAHHHMFLNDLSPIEDQLKWLKKAGFKAKVRMLKLNTALIICEK